MKRALVTAGLLCVALGMSVHADRVSIPPVNPAVDTTTIHYNGGNQLGIVNGGVGATQITTSNLRLTGGVGTTPAALATFGTCNSSAEGLYATQTNSTAACVDGATATSGGTTHCIIYCNGSNWIQMAAGGGIQSAQFELGCLGLGSPLNNPTLYAVMPVTEAGTIQSASATVQFESAGASGNITVSLCTDSSCGIHLVECTYACNSAVGTVTTCTVVSAPLAANSSPAWSVTSHCTAGHDPAGEYQANVTVP